MFLIIDGSSMLSSSYYGNLPKQILFAKTEEERAKHYDKIMHAADGTYTNGIFTMLRTVLKIIKNQKPDHIAFVFDKTRNTFRRGLQRNQRGNTVTFEAAVYSGRRNVTRNGISSILFR